jgi:RNA polymerase sigma-70 factor, ECF subfamily
MNVSELPQKTLNARFELLFRDEMPRLYNYLCYQTRDRDAAEDITARTCEKALAKVGQYDPARGELRVWMFGIARNELRAYYRSAQAAPREIPFESLPEFSLPAASPEQELVQKEAFAAVLAAVSALPERDLEAVALRYGAGLPVAQIAAVLGMSENNAAVTLHRAVDRLKKSLLEVPYGI